MPTTTRGEDIFHILNDYFKKWNLSWKSCVEVCTDGAPSMVGSIKGLASFCEATTSQHHNNSLFLA